MLFEGWGVQFAGRAWETHPFHPKNNVNGIDGDVNGDGKVDWLASRGHSAGVLWFETPGWQIHEIDTDIKQAPWHVVDADVKRHARLNCIRHLLDQVPYDTVDRDDIELPDRVFNPKYERRVLPKTLYVPEHY